MSVYIYPLLSVIAVSLVSLIGVFTLALKEDLLRKYIFILVSLAVGALIGDTFIHLIPESFAEIDNAKYISLSIIGGIFIFFILEKFLHWHHHSKECNSPHPVGKLILVSDGVHNFIDGLLIGGSFLVGTELGLATTIAVILHEIPQEIGDFGILIHSGFSKSKALWLNFLSGSLSIAGVIASFLLGQFAENLSVLLIPITAGGFIYIAMSDLIPELHKTKDAKSSLLQLMAVALGIGSMLLLLKVG